MEQLLDPLTERELEVLQLLSEGFSNQQIAEDLYLAIGTVKAHCHNIYSKLDVSNRSQALLKAQNLGVLQRQGSHSTMSYVRRVVPKFSTPFIGRYTERELLNNLIIDKQATLVTILGTGGMGKTRLATQVLQDIAQHFSHGIAFVSLRESKTSDDVVLSICRVLDIATKNENNPKNKLLTYLQSRNLLIVLDNIEHLIDDLSFLLDILDTAPNVSLLVTSREKLNISAEIVFVLEGMDYSQNFYDEMFSESDSVQLFLHHARSVSPNFDLQSGQFHYLLEIFKLTQGMPLAMVLAASLLELISLEDLAKEIRMNLDVLETQMRDVPSRQRSIRATFDYSISRLDDEQRQVFAQLTVFRGGFSLDAARVVANATLRTLQNLVNRSLLTANEGQYRIHELLRQYGEELLNNFSNSMTLYDVHSKYYLNTLAEQERAIKGTGQIDALNHITQNFENIRQAWRWAITRNKLDLISNALEALSIYFYIEARLFEGTQLLNLLYIHLTENNLSDSVLAGRILSRLSLLNKQFQTPQSNLDDCEKSLKIAIASDNPLEIAISHEALGHHHLLVSQDLNPSMLHLQQSYQLHTQFNEPFFKTRILHKIGFCYAFLGDLDTTYDYCMRALDVARRSNNLYGIGHALNNAAAADHLQGNYVRAVRHVKESALTFDKFNYTQAKTSTSCEYAELLLFEGKFEEAHQIAQKALNYAIHTNVDGAIAYSLSVLSICKSMNEQHTEAYQLTLEALTILDNYTYPSPIVPLAIAIVSVGINDYDNAYYYLKMAYDIIIDMNAKAGLTWLLPIMAFLSEDETAIPYLALAMTHPLSPIAWFERWDALQHYKLSLEEKFGQEQFHDLWESGRQNNIDAVVETFWERHPEKTL